MGWCGPSASEQTIAGAQSSLALSMQSDFQTRFAKQSTLLDNLNASLTPVIAAGPEQQGFSPEELAARNTQAINAAGAANRNAVQSASNSMAGRGQSRGAPGVGGGDSGLQSGIESAIRGGIASSSANQLANAQNEITSENYAVGRSNYRTALAGSQALSGEYNPQGFGGMAQSGLSTAFGEEDKINSENQAVGRDILGAVTGIGKAALGFATGGISNLISGGRNAGSESGGGAEQFFSGGLDALRG